ncbi:hypothetical protein U1Q18_010985 [Sarracenia purpurea var. burkii]
MGSRIPSHQLSNGLYVSGRPEQLKERQPTMASCAVPYTGGDIKNSGELGKMFDVTALEQNHPPSKSSRPSSSSSASQHNSGSVRSGSNSGQLGTKSSNSGPIPKKFSGPMVPLQPTGLITSGPLGSSVGRRSGQLDPSGSTGKVVYGSAVTNLKEEVKLGFKVSRTVMWVFLVVAMVVLMVGAFLMVAVKRAVVLAAVAGILALVLLLISWNCAWKKRGLLGFLKRYPVAELRGAIDGQYVKVTGHKDISEGCQAKPKKQYSELLEYLQYNTCAVVVTTYSDDQPIPLGFRKLEKKLKVSTYLQFISLQEIVMRRSGLTWNSVVALVAVRDNGRGLAAVVVVLQGNGEGVGGDQRWYWCKMLSHIFVLLWRVVTCGSIPLESSFQRVPRCVYVSTELYEYSGWSGKSANPKHRFFSWGCRHAEKYVADFYVSDFQSGLRALVKAGYGSKVAAFVEPTTVVDITNENRELSPTFLRWLADRSLSSDDRIMRLKEGYIKEGTTVTVMGVVRRHDNVLMIVPSAEPLSTGCQWARCLLPTYIEGLVLLSNESQNADVIPV